MYTQQLQSIFIGVDINPMATEATLETSKRNDVHTLQDVWSPLTLFQVLVEVINTSFLSGLEERLKGKIDVLLFNPPYVPTSDEELEESLKDPNKIDAAAWAGGTDGRRVLDKLLPKVKVVFVVNWCVDVISKEYLSPRGCFYLVAVHENNPNEIISIMRSQKMKGKVKLWIHTFLLINCESGNHEEESYEWAALHFEIWTRTTVMMIIIIIIIIIDFWCMNTGIGILFISYNEHAAPNLLWRLTWHMSLDAAQSSDLHTFSRVLLVMLHSLPLWIKH
jgi:hypothetical protein